MCEDFCLFDILTYDSSFSKIQLNMMNDDFYFLQDKYYDFLRKIYFKNELVGFIVGEEYDGKCILELAYILPEYRDKGLFCRELNYFINVYDVVVLQLPNRFVIDSLLEHGFACKLSENLVECDVCLCFIDDDARLFSKYYDLRFCAVVDLNSLRFSPLLDVDVDCFSADLNRDYFCSNILPIKDYLYIISKVVEIITNFN